MLKNYLQNKGGDFLLGVYLFFIGVMYYCLYATSFASTSFIVYTSDLDTFIYLLAGSSWLNASILSLKNIIYTLYMFFTGNSFFSYIWTSFTLYIICAVLVYKLANLYKDSKKYGLIAVFVFTTISPVLLLVFGVNLHLAETMLFLFILYFYEKSNYFSHGYYALLYFLFSLLALLERESVILYLFLVLVLTSYFPFKKKNYFPLIYNAVISLVIVSIILTGKNQGYLFAKLGHWYLYLYLLDIVSLMKIPYLILVKVSLQIKNNITAFYLFLIAAFFGFRFFCSNKTKVRFFLFIEFYIVAILFLYCLTVIPIGVDFLQGLAFPQEVIFDDIFPVIALLSIWISNVFYIYRRYQKYIILLVLCACFLFPVNFFQYLSAFKNKEQALLTGKKENYAIYFDVARELQFYLEKHLVSNLFFILEKEAIVSEVAFNVPNNDFAGVLTDIDSKFEKFYNPSGNAARYFMEPILDILVLNGFSYRYEPANYSFYEDKIPINNENIYLFLFADKNPQNIFDKNQVDIIPLKTWDVFLGDVSVKLHAYIGSKKGS